MPRHVLWRRQYDQDRYMEYVGHQELLQRLKDIMANYLELTAEAKIGFPSTDEGKHWLVLLTHVLEEFQLRFGPYPAGFPDGFMADAQIPRPDSPLARPAISAAMRRGTIPPGSLVKYGRVSYIRPAFQEGLIRISPASFYSDPSLNPAIRDDELELSIHGRGDRARVDVLDKKTLRPVRTIPLTGNLTVTARAPTNYYVYCLSAVLAPRLFSDFAADACLLITRPWVFFERLIGKFAEQLSDWDGFGSAVRYIDPLGAKVQDLNPFLAKHFRFTYQREYRMFWLPRQPATDLPHICVTLGSLADCCELIDLSSGI